MFERNQEVPREILDLEVNVHAYKYLLWEQTSILQSTVLQRVMHDMLIEKLFRRPEMTEREFTEEFDKRFEDLSSTMKKEFLLEHGRPPKSSTDH